MKNLTLVTLSLGLLLGACGDNLKAPADAPKAIDAPPMGFPAAPTLGDGRHHQARHLASFAERVEVVENPQCTSFVTLIKRNVGKRSIGKQHAVRSAVTFDNVEPMGK